MRSISLKAVALRGCNENDHENLYRIFVACRPDLVAAVADWDEMQKQAFLQGQFQAQHDQYRSRYPNARFDVIIADDQVVGNLYVDAGDDEILLVDINLLPEFRNRGIGSALLRDLLDEAEDSNKPVNLHVAQGNPVVCLYQRIGFELVEDQGVYSRMQWRPGSPD